MAERWRGALATRTCWASRPGGWPSRLWASVRSLGTPAERSDAWSRIEPGRWPPGEPLPLSFAQERLWFLDQLDPGTSAYNIPAALRLRGTLDLPALAASLEEIVRRHAALRTTFTARTAAGAGGGAGCAPSPLPLVDLAACPPAAREREVRRLACEEAARPFDLARGPLLRAVLLRLAPEEHAALFTMHHIVSRRLVDGGAGARAGSALPSLRPGLALASAGAADPVRRLRRSGSAAGSRARRWRRSSPTGATRSPGSPVLELPTDRPRPPVQTFRGASRAGRCCPPTCRGGSRGSAPAEGATLFMVLARRLRRLLHR